MRTIAVVIACGIVAGMVIAGTAAFRPHPERANEDDTSDVAQYILEQQRLGRINEIEHAPHLSRTKDEALRVEQELQLNNFELRIQSELEMQSLKQQEQYQLMERQRFQMAEQQRRMEAQRDEMERVRRELDAIQRDPWACPYGCR